MQSVWVYGGTEDKTVSLACSGSYIYIHRLSSSQLGSAGLSPMARTEVPGIACQHRHWDGVSVLHGSTDAKKVSWLVRCASLPLNVRGMTSRPAAKTQSSRQPC